MGRVAFIQNDVYEKMGVMSISSTLKKHGHTCDVFCFDGESNFYKSLFDFKPDIIAYSLHIGEQEFALEVLSKVKEIDNKILTLIGGPYVLVFPEIINEDCVDLMCVGDGEYVCLEILKRLEQKEDFNGIDGLWFKDNKQIHNSPRISYVSDITQLPGLDRDLYPEKYPAIRNQSTKPFILSRGCPYQCSYCYTRYINQCYKVAKAGSHFRMDSPEKVISEIRYVREKYGMDWVRFHDGTINANLKYINKFLKMYADNKLPGFVAYARADKINEEFVSLLKKAGCDKLVFGIQTGNENIRRKLAHREMSDEQIIDACNLLKKYKIRIGVDIMFGWPGETVNEAYETIELCRKINPADVNSNVLIPYPKTEIADYCIENHYVNDITIKDIESLRNSNHSLIKQKNIHRLINLDKLAFYTVKFPLLRPLVRILIHLPPNKLFIVYKSIPPILRYFKYDIKSLRERYRFFIKYIKSML
ncbi:B12-binding domain-containing radical SAM protein [Chloroflexota bacterium]